MGRPKKCTSTSPDREAAVAHINEKINQIETEIDYLTDSEFGRIIDNRTLLNNTIEEKNTFIRSSKAEIKYLKKNRPPNAIPKIKSLQEKVIQAKRDLREEIQLLRDLNKETEAQLKKEKEIDTTLKRRQTILNNLESNLDDYIKVKKIEKDLDNEINRLKIMVN